MKVKIQVTKKGVEFFLDDQEETIKSLIQSLIPEDVEVHWSDNNYNYDDNFIYLISGPHRSADIDVNKFFDASLDASGMRDFFIQIMEKIANWYESIPVSSAEFEVTRIQ